MPQGIPGSPTFHGELMCPSKYLKAVDLDGKDRTLEIAKVTYETLVYAGGAKEKKYLLTFVGAKKQLVLNKTNLCMTGKATGEWESEDWVGCLITLYPTTTKFGSDTVPCIRIRDRRARRRPSPEPEPEPPVEGQDPFASEREPREFSVSDDDIPKDD